MIDAADQADCPAACLLDEDGDGYLAASCGGSDCDDTNGAVNPGALETECNGWDDDCDAGTVDDQDPIDEDDDGYTLGCGADCNDDNPYIHIGVAEACDDGRDNDCDGLPDEEDDECPPNCSDADNDGCRNEECGGTDCDDAAFGINPTAGEDCTDGVDNNCNGLIDDEDDLCSPDCQDADGDGYQDAACGGSDCDDSLATVHPAAGENCSDGLDNDRSGYADDDDWGSCPTGCEDSDGDGCLDVACGGTDCDARDATIHPTARTRMATGLTVPGRVAMGSRWRLPVRRRRQRHGLARFAGGLWTPAAGSPVL